MKNLSQSMQTDQMVNIILQAVKIIKWNRINLPMLSIFQCFQKIKTIK